MYTPDLNILIFPLGFTFIRFFNFYNNFHLTKIAINCITEIFKVLCFGQLLVLKYEWSKIIIVYLIFLLFRSWLLFFRFFSLYYCLLWKVHYQ